MNYEKEKRTLREKKYHLANNLSAAISWLCLVDNMDDYNSAVVKLRKTLDVFLKHVSEICYFEDLLRK